MGVRGIDTLSGNATLPKLFCLPSEKGSTLKGKNLLPGKLFFPFRVDHFSDWLRSIFVFPFSVDLFSERT